ncbi:MAG: molybdopterin-guanine dinucleotide biosynthesis protein B [Lachnospiraceae bacterium]|nr:molybdopterin-guanine dinucleotide biosynthesis protein B [Lachnospiraceae bacterium]
MTYGAVILAGGKSRRMGTNKAELTMNGVRFLDKLVWELSGFEELWVSVDDEERHSEIEYPMVSDAFGDCGPIGGICSAFLVSGADALVVVPCDVPLFSEKLARALCHCLEEGGDVAIAVTEDGREHPLCGVYKKSCQKILEMCIRKKDYKMRNALERMEVKKYQAGRDSWRLKNINTFGEWKRLTKKSCLAISGWKNSGKTTLIEQLIPVLKARGLTIAAIKHDGHSYEADVPGTDSCRFFQAGAAVSLVYDREKYSLTVREKRTDEDVIGLASKGDLVLLEGFKESGYPKIEIVQKEIGGGPIPELAGRIAYVSDIELQTDLPVFLPNDIQGIGDFIVDRYERGDLVRTDISVGGSVKMHKGDCQKETEE